MNGERDGMATLVSSALRAEVFVMDTENTDSGRAGKSFDWLDVALSMLSRANIFQISK